jgi:hypothetical protein
MIPALAAGHARSTLQHDSLVKRGQNETISLSELDISPRYSKLNGQSNSDIIPSIALAIDMIERMTPFRLLGAIVSADQSRDAHVTAMCKMDSKHPHFAQPLKLALVSSTDMIVYL